MQTGTLLVSHFFWISGLEPFLVKKKGETLVLDQKVSPFKLEFFQCLFLHIL